MIELSRHVADDWLVRRTLSVDLDTAAAYLFDATETRDGSEPGTMCVTQFDAEQAEWLWPQIRRAAELLRARAQPALPFPRAA